MISCLAKILNFNKIKINYKCKLKEKKIKITINNYRNKNMKWNLLWSEIN